MKEQQAFADNNQERPRFGNYDLVRRIDMGGMGEVYLARQRTAFGREVALKIIRSDLVHDVTARKRFLREAEVSAHLKHEHILSLVEFGEENGRLFLVTPYIKGGTLAQRLQRGPLSLAEVHQLFSALARAVAYIHRRGVVHRDLKPDNILLDREGEQDQPGQTYVRLIDFGIATIQGNAASPPLTMGGKEMGTLAYMAPERLSGVAAPSNDIYSLGIILYQMLTGQLPNTGTAIALPKPLETIIQRCTAADPADRYASADDLVKAFEYAYRFLSASQQAQQGVQQAIPVEENEHPTPRNIPASRSVQQEQSEYAILQQTGGQPALSAFSRPGSSFRGEDYSAPTSMVEPVLVGTAQRTGTQGTNPKLPARTRKRRKRSLLGALTVITLALLLAVAGVGFLAFQAAIAATITITPQTHAISSVFTVTARPNQTSMNVGNATIPAGGLSSTKNASQQGQTTGQVNCTFGFFGIQCQQGVDIRDVITLTNQIRPGLQSAIAQDVQQKLHSMGATQIGTIAYTDSNYTANPPVGSPGQEVTVTLTEQASVEYVKASDAAALARLLLQQKMQTDLGPHYILLNSLTQIGQPAIQSTDGSGNVTLQIAAGGVAEYQLSKADLQTMQTSIKGMSSKTALAFLATQRGIDTKAITLHISYGDTIPGNIQQIHVIAANPTNLPVVQLPTIKATPTP